MDAPVIAVFLDRDGVVNVNRPDHVKSWDEFKFLPGVFEALADLASARLSVFIVTNQAVINRGLVPREVMDAINAHMKSEIERHGGRLDAVLYCPHVPEEGCGCRKPRPGLLTAAAARYGLDLTRSYVVGDALTDLEAGEAVGCKTILVLTGRGEEQHKVAVGSGRNGYVAAPDLRAAVSFIMQQQRSLLRFPAARHGSVVDIGAGEREVRHEASMAEILQEREVSGGASRG